MSETDVTYMVGAEQDKAEEEAFEAYRRAFAALEHNPCLRTARELCRTYDAYAALVAKGARAA